MKVDRLFVVFCVFFLSCDKKSEVERAIEVIPIEVKIERFDKIFFETVPKDLEKVKKDFPFLFPAGNDNSVWLNKMQDPIWRELYTEVQKVYSNFEPVKRELEELFQHIGYYFPKTKVPKVITVIAEMDYNNKAIYTDTLVLISLELYLGKGHKFYQFPNYLKQNFEQRQIAPDVATSFLRRKIQPVLNKDLLSQMIYCGKQLYVKELLLPKYTEAEIMGYLPGQLLWCQENESYIWRYFIEKELLYSSDQKLIPRFINPAPFSKFYLEIDNESPGSVGAWIGWQIVRSYIQNTAVGIEDLLETDAREIFKQSKYKPKK